MLYSVGGVRVGCCKSSARSNRENTVICKIYYLTQNFTFYNFEADANTFKTTFTVWNQSCIENKELE